MMAKYINADLLKDEILSNAIILNNPKHLSEEDTLCVIDSMSTADVVEVVRCGKCGFRDDNLITTSKDIDCYMCKRHHSLVLLNDFCSYGEKSGSI